jgi:thioredoxin
MQKKRSVLKYVRFAERKDTQVKVYDVWAEWCAPCKRFAPIFDVVAKSFPDVEFIKVNADLEHEFLNKYSIRSIPTLLIIDDSGEVLFQHAGILTEANLDTVVSTYYLAHSHK